MSYETAIAIAANDGVGFIIKKNDPMAEPNSFGDSLMTRVVKSGLNQSSLNKNCRIASIGSSSAIVGFGSTSDIQKIFSIASTGVKNYSQRVFDQQISMKDLSHFIGNEITKISHSSLSPAQPEAILGSWSPQNSAEIFGIDSNGDQFKYQACAIGGEKSQVMCSLSNLNFSNLATNQALIEGLKILMNSFEDEFKFEVARISSETQGIYQDGTNELCEIILKEALRD